MGYLSNTELTVDAILTKAGRAKLAAGKPLDIKYFALADDEIDYTLYEPAHPLGSAYYDYAIKNIPITEASPDETQSMKFKLITSTQNLATIPTINAPGFNSINVTYSISDLAAGGTGPADVEFTPVTPGYPEQYYVVLANSALAWTFYGTNTTSFGTDTPTYQAPFGTEGVPRSFLLNAGGTIRYTPSTTIFTTGTYTTTITITGQITGATLTIPVTLTVNA